MSGKVRKELSFYCKGYHLRDLKRFAGYSDDLIADRTAEVLQEDNVVFIHADYSVTLSVFLPATKPSPSPGWIDFCTNELAFRVPEELEEGDKGSLME